VDIERPFSGTEENFGTVNAYSNSNHLYFETSEKNKIELKKKIKEKICQRIQY